MIQDSPMPSTSRVTVDRRKIRSADDAATVALAKKVAALPTPRVQLTQRLLKFEVGIILGFLGFIGVTRNYKLYVPRHFQACISFVHVLPCDYTLLEENIQIWINNGRLMVLVDDVAGVDVPLPIALDRRTVGVRFAEGMSTVTVIADIVKNNT